MLAPSAWCPRICQEGLGEAEGAIQLGVVQCLKKFSDLKCYSGTESSWGQGLWGRHFIPHFLSGRPVFKWELVLAKGSSAESGEFFRTKIREFLGGFHLPVLPEVLPGEVGGGRPAGSW